MNKELIEYLESVLDQDWAEVEAHLDANETLFDYFITVLDYALTLAKES